MNKRQEQAFREYVDASMRRHYRVAWSLCGNHHDAEDLVQHAMVQLYKHWGSVDSDGNLDAYVRTTVTHRFFDTRRSAFARHEMQRSDLPDEAAGGASAADLLVDAQFLSQLLVQLSPVERAALVLRYIADQPVVDVAAELGYSVAQTKRYIARGLQRMRILSEDGATHG